MTRLLFFLLLCLTVSATAAPAADSALPYVEIRQARDFSRLARKAHDEGKLIMLEISATDCTFCKRLEADFIRPMLRSGDYGHVLIRKLDRDDSEPVTDFTGHETTPEAFAGSYRVRFVPTLLFLDATGHEVAERLVGYNTPELFGGYLDDALVQGMKKIARQEPATSPTRLPPGP